VKEAVAAHCGLLLGISSPWQLREVKLKVKEWLMYIEGVHAASRPVCCRQCRRGCAQHDHAAERTLRHLDVLQFTT